MYITVLDIKTNKIKMSFDIDVDLTRAILDEEEADIRDFQLNKQEFMDLSISKDDLKVMIGECEANIKDHKKIIAKHEKSIIVEQEKIDELLVLLSASDFEAALDGIDFAKNRTLKLYCKNGTLRKEVQQPKVTQADKRKEFFEKQKQKQQQKPTHRR